MQIIRTWLTVGSVSEPVYGIDFGTTNSAVARADAQGGAQLVELNGTSGACATWRTLLYFDPVASPGEVGVYAGAEGIARYEDNDAEGRVIQSIKSHLASSSFTKTTVHGRAWTLERLVGAFIRELERAAGVQFGARVAIGRPVRYWGAKDADDDARAVRRMTEALALAGISEPLFVPEPIAAAYAYGRRLDASQTVMIADFGGGTSDFSIVRISPVPGSAPQFDILATGGVALGGDSFDARLIDNVVTPKLGKGSSYTTEMGGRAPIPAWIFNQFQRWHQLSHLKTPQTQRLLDRVARGADKPEAVRALNHIVDNNLGLLLHGSITGTKVSLTDSEHAEFVLRHYEVALEDSVLRSQFDTWIEAELAVIDETVVSLLSEAGLAPAAIDRVFTTGGSSLVPAVRAQLDTRFGSHKVEGGDELTSVAVGLAEYGKQAFSGENRL